MERLLLILVIPMLFITVSCERESNNTKISLESVNGYVQKGPYLNGTGITITELTSEMIPTGRTFSSQIIDNNGSFEIKNVELSSEFVELKANGFYFNEITNTSSNAQLTLYAITDILDTSRVNVNVLSTLEKNRVNFLIANGASFEVAKSQAQSEVLEIFEIQKPDIEDSEILDISKPGDDNAILLAISVMLQGYLSEADLSELISNISTDIREDGELNSNILGEILINNASVLNTIGIRNNLEDRYETMGVEVLIPEFEKYIKQFVDSTDYIATNKISYPIKYNSKNNILVDSAIIVESGIIYSMAVYLPNGTTIRIISKPTVSYDWGPAGFLLMDVIGFIVENNYPDNMTFTSKGNDQTANIPVMFGESGSIPPTSIDFYIYENESDTVTRIKTVRSFEIE